MAGTFGHKRAVLDADSHLHCRRQRLQDVRCLACEKRSPQLGKSQNCGERRKHMWRSASELIHRTTCKAPFHQTPTLRTFDDHHWELNCSKPVLLRVPCQPDHKERCRQHNQQKRHARCHKNEGQGHRGGSLARLSALTLGLGRL